MTLMLVGQPRVIAHHQRQILEREGNSAVGEVSNHGSAHGEGERFGAHTGEGRTMTLVRLCWRTWPGSQCRGLGATGETAAPAAIMTVPDTLLDMDAQASVTLSAAYGRALRTGGAYLASGAQGDGNADISPGPHRHALLPWGHTRSTRRPGTMASRGCHASTPASNRT